MRTENSAIAPLLRIVTIIECIVLIGAGAGLFLFYDFMKTQWAWSITPFNSGFLGATYLASAVATIMLARIARWSIARLIVPMIIVFTLVVLFASVLHLDRFIFTNVSTWIWFALYIVIPINALYHLWLYRRLAPANASTTPRLIQAWLILQGAVLFIYAVAMIAVPSTFTAFWPWKIDDFHAQMYSAIGFTAAIAGIMVWRRGSSDEFLTLGLTQITLGTLAIVGVVSRSAKVDYSAAGTWLWLAAFAIGLLAGIVLAMHGYRLRSGVAMAEAKLSASL